MQEALVNRNGGLRCRNCRSRSKRKGLCPFCKRHAPIQNHHVAGREISPVIVKACTNCHAVLTFWQRQRERRLKAQELDEEAIQFNLCFYGYEDLERLYRMRNGEEIPTGIPWEYYIER